VNTATHSTINVLHLEDSDLDAEFVKDRLLKSGLDVAVDRVSDRQTFVHRLKEREYDLILSDYQVPTFEGLAALELALKYQPETPFLFVSGAMGEELAVETLKRGATDYVLKDRLTRLPAAVNRALAEVRERSERRAAEDSARRANARASAILESMLEAFVLLNPDGLLAYVNAAFERMSHIRREDVLGKDYREVFPGSVGTAVEATLRRALTESVAVEIDHHDETTDRWFHLRAYPWKEEGGLSVFIGDITERKRAEVELADREQRYRLVADASNDAIWDWNLVTSHIIWSEGMRTHFGYTEEAVGTDPSWWVQHIHPQDVQRVTQGIQERIERGSDVWQDEHRFRRADGSYAFVSNRGRIVRDSAGKPVRMVGSMLDLSERRQSEEALRAAEERFAFVRRSSGVGFWYCDLPFDVLEWDELVKAHFFLPPDARVTIDTFFERIHPEDREPTREAIRRATSECVPYDVDYRTVDPVTGAMRWVRAIGRTSFNAEGKAERFDGVTIDVTLQKRAQDERERLLRAAQEARDEAEAANHMKDQFLATLSHELRTPLNAIVGWTRILRSSKIEEDDRKKGLEVIDRNARAQARLIDDLLDISRIISGKLTLDVQQVDLHEVIDGALAAVMPAADARGIRVHSVLDSRTASVVGDPNRLQQVVWNLLSNAVKFTPRGGKVQVILERVDSHVEIKVIDSGQGIHPDFLPHVFDRFRQADGSTTRRHGGLGLGLSIVRQLAEMHGGSVRATSPGEGRGATFVVKLPISAVRPEPVEIARTVRTSSFNDGDGAYWHDIEGLRVLVVDDEPDARALMKRVLDERGAKVALAGSAREALQLVESFRPEILVSDVGMPDEDGYELIRKVRRSLSAKELPAAALTAFASPDDRMRAMRAGFQVHVAKPVAPEELLSVVATLSARTGRDFIKREAGS
jgi:PAS domain S-box-containing protein